MGVRVRVRVRVGVSVRVRVRPHLVVDSAAALLECLEREARRDLVRVRLRLRKRVRGRVRVRVGVGVRVSRDLRLERLVHDHTRRELVGDRVRV